jgi:hypothetical protein
VNGLWRLVRVIETIFDSKEGWSTNFGLSFDLEHRERKYVFGRKG